MHKLSAMHPEDKRVLTSSNAIAAAWRPVLHSPSSLRFPSSSSSAPSSFSSSSCGHSESGLRGMCTGCTTSSAGDTKHGGGGAGEVLAEEGWNAFLCAVREEEERGDMERRDAAAAAEREVYATAAQMFYQRSGGLLGGGGAGSGVGGGVGMERGAEGCDPALIPMFPIGPPPPHTSTLSPSSSLGGSPDTKVRRTSYLIG